MKEEPMSFYRHQSGGAYLRNGIALHTESGGEEQMVIYTSLYRQNTHWARPRDGVGGWDTPMGNQPRFEWIPISDLSDEELKNLVSMTTETVKQWEHLRDSALTEKKKREKTSEESGE